MMTRDRPEMPVQAYAGPRHRNLGHFVDSPTFRSYARAYRAAATTLPASIRL